METNNFDPLVGKIQLENLEIEENKIAQSLIAKSSTIWQTASAKLLPADNEMVEIRQHCLPN